MNSLLRPLSTRFFLIAVLSISHVVASAQQVATHSDSVSEQFVGTWKIDSFQVTEEFQLTLAKQDKMAEYTRQMLEGSFFTLNADHSATIIMKMFDYSNRKLYWKFNNKQRRIDLVDFKDRNIKSAEKRMTIYIHPKNAIIWIVDDIPLYLIMMKVERD